MNIEESLSVVSSFTQAMVARMEDHIRGKYNIDLKIKVICSASVCARFSKGGTRNGNPFIKILGNHYAQAAMDNTTLNEREYNHIKDDPVIGSLTDVSWKQALSSLIAHEVAHVVQFYPEAKYAAKRALGLDYLDDRDTALKGHDLFWQKIYADLRITFVNHGIFSETIKVVPVVPKNKKAGNWYSKSLAKHGGMYSYYYDSITNELIGTIFKKHRRFAQVWDTLDSKWVITEFDTVAAARKAYLGL